MKASSLRAELRAGTMPAFDHAEDWSDIQPMNVFAAFARLVSSAACSVMKKLWEFAHAASWSPMTGRVAMP